MADHGPHCRCSAVINSAVRVEHNHRRTEPCRPGCPAYVQEA